MNKWDGLMATCLLIFYLWWINPESIGLGPIPYSMCIDYLSSISAIEGKKMFEVRFNDRDYQVGDKLTFELIEAKANSCPDVATPFPLPVFNIVYVHHDLGMAEGYVVLGLEKDEVH